MDKGGEYDIPGGECDIVQLPGTSEVPGNLRVKFSVFRTILLCQFFTNHSILPTHPANFFTVATFGICLAREEK